MNLEQMIKLLEERYNVYYDAEEVRTIEKLLYQYYVDSDMLTQEELDLIQILTVGMLMHSMMKVWAWNNADLKQIN